MRAEWTTHVELWAQPPTTYKYLHETSNHLPTACIIELEKYNFLDRKINALLLILHPQEQNHENKKGHQPNKIRKATQTS